MLHLSALELDIGRDGRGKFDDRGEALGIDRLRRWAIGGREQVNTRNRPREEAVEKGPVETVQVFNRIADREPRPRAEKHRRVAVDLVQIDE